MWVVLSSLRDDSSIQHQPVMSFTCGALDHRLLASMPPASGVAQRDESSVK